MEHLVVSILYPTFSSKAAYNHVLLCNFSGEVFDEWPRKVAGLKWVISMQHQFFFACPTHFWAHLVSAMGLLTSGPQQVQVKVKVEGR